MTRNEWYIWWRKYRINNPKQQINYVTILREYYYLVLTVRQRIKFNLIKKYAGNASARLLQEREELEIIGKENAENMWKRAICSRNPLLEMMAPDAFVGKYYPVPLVIGSNENNP